MNQVTTTEQNTQGYEMGFMSSKGFELMQRAAKLLSTSTLVPGAYRAFDDKKGENPSAMSNCVVALNMAQRMRADPLMVMQNLYIVEGRPSWSSQWIIAAINGCGRFSPLRFEFTDLGPVEASYQIIKEWVNNKPLKETVKVSLQNYKCVAWATELATGQRIDGPAVTMEMAVREGWYGKNGSKWQTMHEVMLRYRASSFFGKLYAPELLFGLQTVEEAHDIIDVTPMPAREAMTDPQPLKTIEREPLQAAVSASSDGELTQAVVEQMRDAERVRQQETKRSPDTHTLPGEPDKKPNQSDSDAPQVSAGQVKALESKAKARGLSMTDFFAKAGCTYVDNDSITVSQFDAVKLWDLEN
jgi:hypothetical protein